MAIAACGLSNSSAPAPAPAVHRAGRPLESASLPQQVETGNCIDGTSSSAYAYAVHMRDILADAIAGWARQPAQLAGAARPPIPGLRFVLRAVTTNSYSTDGAALDVSIPGAPGLAQQPSPNNNPSFATDIQRWTVKMMSWKQASAAANSAAAALAARVRRYQVARGTWSAIYSCIGAAAAQLAPAHGPRTRLTLMSDLENNRPVTGLDLRGDAVLMVTICPAHASATCPQRCGGRWQPSPRRDTAISLR